METFNLIKLLSGDATQASFFVPQVIHGNVQKLENNTKIDTAVRDRLLAELYKMETPQPEEPLDATPTPITQPTPKTRTRKLPTAKTPKRGRPAKSTKKVEAKKKRS
jgi:hypothetical protein